MNDVIIDFDCPIETARVLTFFRNLRGKHRVTVVKQRRRRSDAQNRYMWGVAIPYVASGIQKAYGEAISSEEVHEYLKNTFLGGRTMINKKTGEMIVIPASSAKLSTTEFMEYIERIAKFAAESLSVAIPFPNEEEISSASDE